MFLKLVVVVLSCCCQPLYLVGVKKNALAELFWVLPVTNSTEVENLRVCQRRCVARIDLRV